MANRCEGCNKRIPRGASHCGKCARGAGGYRSNMAAELAEADRKRRAKEAAAELQKAKQSAARAARQKRIAERAAAMKASDQKKAIDRAKRIAAQKVTRQISNVRGRPEPKPEKKRGWW